MQGDGHLLYGVKARSANLQVTVLYFSETGPIADEMLCPVKSFLLDDLLHIRLLEHVRWRTGTPFHFVVLWC